MVSLSTGDARIEGRRLRYELRMPLYEVAHVKDAGSILLDHIRFSGAKLLEKSCKNDADTFVCTAVYEFAAEPDRLEVECKFYTVTVPNHVHLLRAYLGDKSDQAVFDLSFPRGEIRFRPPSAFESALTEIGAGMLRALGGAAQLLFLGSLVLAARSRRELLTLAGMFFLGQAISCVIVPRLSWQPAPRFVEAAAALTIAYLAVEILLLPEAGKRWAVLGVLGLFHGLGLALFVSSTQYSPAWVLSGVALAEFPVIFGLMWLFARLTRMAPAIQPVRVCASVLFAVGVIWFFLRLRS
jgi:hypothetical protein